MNDHGLEQTVALNNYGPDKPLDLGTYGFASLDLNNHRVTQALDLNNRGLEKTLDLNDIGLDKTLAPNC